MATIKAFIRTSKSGNIPCNVRFRLTDGRDKQFFGTSNLIVYSEEWDAKKERIKDRIPYDSAKRVEFNNSILDLKKEILQAYNEYRGEPASEWLVVFFQMKYCSGGGHKKTEETFFTLYDDFIESLDISDLRRRHYQVVKRQLERYEKYIHRKLDIHTFNDDHLRHFKEFLYNEHKFALSNPRLYESSDNREKPKERSENTISGILKKIRTFFNYLNKEGKTSNKPFENFEIGTAKYGTPIYITMEERNQIADFNFSFNRKLGVQRDIFIFQCLTGCRVGDLIHLKKNNVQNKVLTYIPSKTISKNPKTVQVPLSKQAMMLVDKYSDLPGDKLFSFISPEKYNDAIKDIFTLAKIKRIVTWYNPKTKVGEQRHINEIASSHLARRTFIGNLYSQVQDPNLIGSMTGHVEGSKAFVRYRDIDIATKRDLIDNHLD
jgi:integrase